MTNAIGIDSIEIERFVHWEKYSHKSLRRIFAQSEIDYCLSCTCRSAQRFAARFAAKEAFFKALCTSYQTAEIPFLTVARSVHVETQKNGAPVLNVDWDTLQTFNIMPCRSCVSMTHSKLTATAVVIFG